MHKNNLWSILFLAAVKWKSLKIWLPNTSFKMLFLKGKKAKIQKGIKNQVKTATQEVSKGKTGTENKA